MANASLNLFRVSINFKAFNVYEIEFVGIQLDNATFYSITSKASRHFKNLPFPVIAYNGTLAVRSSNKLDIDSIKGALSNILRKRGLRCNEIKITEKVLKPNDNILLFQQLIERFSAFEINAFLRSIGFKTMIRGKHISVSLKDHIKNAHLSMGSYRAERQLVLRVISNKNDPLLPFLQIDVRTSIEGISTIWEQLNRWLERRNKTLSDLKNDVELQEEVNLEFRSDNPRLTTTYIRTSAGMEKKDIYYFVDFDFRHTPKTRMIDHNNKKISVEEYYLQRYNIKIREQDQLIVNVRRALRGKSRSGSFEPIPIPSNLVVECPDTKVLQRYDFSYEYSRFVLLSPEERFKLINLVATPLISNGLISSELTVNCIETAKPILFDGKNHFSFYDGYKQFNSCFRFPKLKSLKILFFGKSKQWFASKNGWELLKQLKKEFQSQLTNITKSTNQPR